MRLKWFTIIDARNVNTGQSVLWTDHGFYAWTNIPVLNENIICIDFYPRPPHRREIFRVGTFQGDTRIADADDAVERDIAERAGMTADDECVRRLHQEMGSINQGVTDARNAEAVR